MSVPDGVRPPPTDPMRGARGVFAATLILEAIVVLLALFVVHGSPLGTGVIVALGLAMIVVSGLQRRSWGLTAALTLQVLLILAGFVFAPALGAMGIVFAIVWAILVVMRGEVARRMKAGTLPSQQDG